MLFVDSLRTSQRILLSQGKALHRRTMTSNSTSRDMANEQKGGPAVRLKTFASLHEVNPPLGSGNRTRPKSPSDLRDRYPQASFTTQGTRARGKRLLEAPDRADRPMDLTLQARNLNQSRALDWSGTYRKRATAFGTNSRRGCLAYRLSFATFHCTPGLGRLEELAAAFCDIGIIGVLGPERGGECGFAGRSPSTSSSRRKCWIWGHHGLEV